jgi:hypothetical protein
MRPRLRPARATVEVGAGPTPRDGAVSGVSGQAGAASRAAHTAGLAAGSRRARIPRRRPRALGFENRTAPVRSGGMLSRRSARSRSARARSIRMSFHTPVSIGRRVTRRIGRSSATTVTIVSRAPSPVANLLAASNAPSLSETVPAAAIRWSFTAIAAIAGIAPDFARRTIRSSVSSGSHKARAPKPKPQPRTNPRKRRRREPRMRCERPTEPAHGRGEHQVEEKLEPSRVPLLVWVSGCARRDWAVRAECAAGAPGIERVLAHRFRSGQCVERVGRRSSRCRHVCPTSVEYPSWSSPATPRSRSPTL